jgi:hypothetical protein
MRKRKKKSLGSTMRSPDRFIVFNVGTIKTRVRGYGKAEACSRRTFTSYGDAAKAAWRCSKQGKVAGVPNTPSEPCFLLHGLPGSEKLVGRCFKGKCSKPEPGDTLMMAKCKLTRAQFKKARGEMIMERVMKHASRDRGIGPGPGKSAVKVGAKYDPETKTLGRARRRR